MSAEIKTLMIFSTLQMKSDFEQRDYANVTATTRH